MKLWILEPKEEIVNISDETQNLWDPWYDKAFGFIVRAETEQQARAIASLSIGDEGKDAWVNPKFSTCEELTIEGAAGVVMRDFSSA